MTSDPEQMTDAELDVLLAHASKPPLPLRARQNLQDMLAKADVGVSDLPNTVVALRPAKPAPSRLGWLAGLPLAASLAFGIYIGSGGTVENYLPTAAYDLLAGTLDNEDATTGIEEIEDFAEDELS